MKKIIVTGGAGFIGSHLIKALKSLGHKVEIIDLAYDPKTDIRNLEWIKPLFIGAEYVFHLAAVPSVQFSLEYPNGTDLVNLNGTVNVLISAKEAGVKRVIFSSSAAVYGNQEKLPVNEEASVYPMSPYALQKFGSEEYLKLFARISNLETVSLRYFNIYGEGQDASGDYASVIPKFIEKRKLGEPLPIIGDGLNTRDFVNVSDVVSANILAMESKKVGKGEVINIASGVPTSVKRIAELVGGSIEHLPSRIEIKDSVADISLAKNILNWEPEVTIEEGIKKLLK